MKMPEEGHKLENNDALLREIKQLKEGVKTREELMIR